MGLRRSPAQQGQTSPAVESRTVRISAGEALPQPPLSTRISTAVLSATARARRGAPRQAAVTTARKRRRAGGGIGLGRQNIRQPTPHIQNRITPRHATNEL